MTLGWGWWAVMTGCISLLIAAAFAYGRRWTVPRPPIGVFRSSDLVFMTVMVVAAPLLYLHLPGTFVAAVFGLVGLVAVQATLAPVMGGRAGLLAATALCAGTFAAWASGHSLPTRVFSDAVLAIAVVGVGNLWVQGGLRAGQVAAFSSVLTGYDLIATTMTDVTHRFAAHVQGLPFAPVFELAGGHTPVSIGLGDLVMLAVFPLAMDKAFGRRAGIAAAATGVAVCAGVGMLFVAGAADSSLPLLTVLGPVIVTQYVVRRRSVARERRVVEWRSQTAAPARPTGPAPAVSAALAVAIPEWVSAGDWMAIDGDRVVGVGSAPGLARKDARERGCLAVPVVRQR